MDLLLRRRMMMAQTFGPIEPASDGKIWAYYDVTTTSNNTTLIWQTSGLSKMEVDGVAMNVASSYRFSTTGEHLVKFTLSNPSYVAGIFGQGGCPTKVYLPSSVISTGTYMFYRPSSQSPQVFSAPGLQTLGNGSFNNAGHPGLILDLPSLTNAGEGTFSAFVASEIADLGQITVSPAFINLSGCTRVSLPATVTSIPANFLFLAYDTKVVEVLAVEPPTLGGGPFSGMTDYVIKVPADSVSAYKAASGWSTYASIIYPL